MKLDVGQVKKVMNIFEDMKGSGFEPNVVTYGTLLNACAKGYEVGRAQQIWLEMHEKQIEASAECYTAMINACVRDNSLKYFKLAYKYFEEMKIENKDPSFRTYGCLLNACDKRDDLENALKLYHEAFRQGIILSDDSHNIIIEMCTRMEKLDVALKAIKYLTKMNRNISEQTMNSVIRALSKNYIGHALVLYRMMKKKNEKFMERDTYNILIISSIKEYKINVAYDLYVEMMQLDLDVNKTTGSMLIKGLCESNNLELAMRVADDMFMRAYLGNFIPKSNLKSNERQMTVIEDHQIHLIPNIEALGCIICALLNDQDRIKEAMYIFQMICSLNLDNHSGLCQLVRRKREVFECLIEFNCRIENLNDALFVFDEWKDAAMIVMTENKMKFGEFNAFKM